MITNQVTVNNNQISGKLHAHDVLDVHVEMMLLYFNIFRDMISYSYIGNMFATTLHKATDTQHIVKIALATEDSIRI